MGFIANPNAQIRLLAAENLVPYSLAEPNVFKAEKLQPIKHLSFLVRDHPVRRARLCLYLRLKLNMCIENCRACYYNARQLVK